MLSSFLRPKRGRRHANHSPFSSPYDDRRDSPASARTPSRNARRRPARDYDGSEHSHEDEREHDDNEEAVEDGDDHDEEDEDDEDDEDGLGESTPLLPIFSAEHLGKLLSASLRLQMLRSALICEKVAHMAVVVK